MKRHYLVILFLLVYAGALSYKLIASPMPFYDWDESLYVQTGKEMIERRFFLFPVWQGKPWLDKPPLVPLVYGIIMKGFFFISPEISTRLFTLLIALMVLSFCYVLYLKVIREPFLTTLVVILIAFTPLFLQRAQVVNLDIFLLLGWLGYLIFFRRFWPSSVFLLIGILSKSLLGLYPIAIMAGFYLFLFLTKKICPTYFNLQSIRHPEGVNDIYTHPRGVKVAIDQRAFDRTMRRLSLHFLMALSWFLLMLALYQKPFFDQHIIESHFKRVTASIESHFGQKTYYLDLIAEQFGPLIWFSLMGMVWLIHQLKTKRLTAKQVLSAGYLLPWFLFLNLTKTKIFWYLVPALPQFAFFSLVWLKWLRRKKLFYYLIGLMFLLYLVYFNLFKMGYLAKRYSDFNDYYFLALDAAGHCERLIVLEDSSTRKSMETLAKMNLLITTSTWWGSHPSIVYYFGKKVDFIYDVVTLKKQLQNIKKTDCVVLNKQDNKVVKGRGYSLQKRKQFRNLLLYFSF